jgi:hypothetical protein
MQLIPTWSNPNHLFDTTKKSVSFDFDDTIRITRIDDDLGIIPTGWNHDIIHVIREWSTVNIWIITSRWHTNISAVVEFIKEHQLPICGIFATNSRWKTEILEELEIVMHFDDDAEEISRLSKCIGILIETSENDSNT